MFDSLFASKNKKLVLKLQKEHKELVRLVTEIVNAYDTGEKQLLLKKLIGLKNLALTHLMTEDVEFYILLKDSQRSTKEIENLVHKFEEDFGTIKLALINFFNKYTDKDKDSLYDSKFMAEFKNIVAVLSRRIEFEETHLYKFLMES